ncbi:phage tail tape measure protein, partial [Otoolea muris]|uniref:phage tail tape measure protein n=1 Tax=Otoolea muris TaxID=2941515 RepID=UPI002F3FD56F
YEILLEAKDKITPLLTTLGNGLRGFAGKSWSVTMRAVDLATSPVRGILNVLKNPLLQAGAVLGVSIGMKDTVDTYKDFEAAMSQVQAISGATGSEMGRLTDKAKEMGAGTKFTAEESAEAFNYMAMAGWKTGDMLDGIEGILSLAAASGESLAATSDIVTDALTAFGLSASDSGHFADVLAQASSNANTNVGMLGESFKYVAPVAGAMKYSVEDVSLALGLMANASVKGSMAGTSLKTALANMASPTDKMAVAMQEYGISLADSGGQMKTLKGVLDNLRESLGDLTETEQVAAATQIFGKEAMAGMLAIVNATEKDYNKLADAVSHADGASARMAGTMLDNLKGSLTLLQSAADGVKLSAGERLSPYIRGLADWLTAQMPGIEQGIGEFMDRIDIQVERMQGRFKEISATQEWQDAGFLGKTKIAWDEFIAEPFSEWWGSTGKARFAGFAEDIGSGIGAGLKTGIMALLGIDLGETLNEGASIGASFAKGFSEGFDFEAVSGKLWEGFKNMLSSAGKLLPGGEAPGLSSFLSAVMLGKMALPLIGIGKGAASIGKGLFGTNAAAAALAGGTALAGGIAGGLSLISGFADMNKAYKSEDWDEKSAYSASGLYKTGGVAAGAAAGAAIGSIIPGIGTAVGALAGAGLGGVAGWIRGNKVKEEYQENVKEMQAEAEKAQKFFEITGFSINDAVFETKALNDAIHDTEVSAGQLGILFQEAVGANLKSHFGDMKLSLAEIKEAASDIVFDRQKESLEAFSAALETSETSLSSLKNTLQEMGRLNWTAALGTEMSESEMGAYKAAVDSMVAEAKGYVRNKHYEATLSVGLLVGAENSESVTGGLDTMYGGIQSQIDEAGAELNRALSEALSDGVLSTKDMLTVHIGGVDYEMDEASAIAALQDQVAEITQKVANAQSEAKLEALQIRYGGARLDSESFAQLQEELAANVSAMTADYDKALEVGLTSLKLQLSEGAIDQSQYDELKAQIEEGYNSQLEDLQVRVESFQLDTIAEAYGTALDGILPEIEGTTGQKLSEAMGRALDISPEPAEWTSEQISEWFGLESLSAETQTAVGELLQATAETIPSRLAESLAGQISTLDWSGISGAVEIGLAAALAEPGYSGAGAAVSSGVGAAILDADMSEINSAVDTLKSNTDAAVDSAFGAGVSTTMPVHVTLDYQVANPAKTFTITGNGASSSASLSVAANAAGGYVSGGPQLSWLAEEGYGEFVIPTNPSRRARALDLYEQAGAALGVSAFAAGGYAGGSSGPRDMDLYRVLDRDIPASYSGSADGEDSGEPVQSYAPVAATGSPDGTGTPEVHITVNLSPEFTIQNGDGQSEESIIQAVMRHMEEISDQVSGQVARTLMEIFSNMPVKGA